MHEEGRIEARALGRNLVELALASSLADAGTGVAGRTVVVDTAHGGSTAANIEQGRTRQLTAALHIVVVHEDSAIPDAALSHVDGVGAPALTLLELTIGVQRAASS